MRYVWLFLLLDFAALNVYTFAVGDWAMLMDYLGNLGPWGVIASVDLLIALFIGMAWMVMDARKREVKVWPYVVGTFLTGSLALLVYLTKYAFEDHKAESSQLAAAE